MDSGHGRSGRAAAGWVPVLRRAVRRQLDGWGLAGLADDATLVVGELATNAVRHGEPPVRVAVTLRCAPGVPRTVRIEVADGGAGIDLDVVRAWWGHPAFPLGESGRGLYMVDAVSREWGDRSTSAGHTVWVDLAPTP
ncbi:ATP-binding protein [Streptomyces tropicalis]|uniref:ATP-binding protein n=1 Tax=Streptomyces tropicalis TaxID=3034234 RepID=A0ABT6AA10_9ACTN|nr:ATP-binding protein [Streptomyces tropicalis]MDF3301485.1 ATP-binding protein [Streptomyces tropicalis]